MEDCERSRRLYDRRAGLHAGRFFVRGFGSMRGSHGLLRLLVTDRIWLTAGA